MLEAFGFIAFFLVVFSILLLVHEAGHFFVAKASGITVLEFGLGFPPRLWGIQRSGTVYSINALPFGAFVRMLGEEDPKDVGSLAGKSARARLMVMSAGPFMNALLALVLFTVMFMVPRDVPVGEVLVQEVASGSPAQEAEIQPGDMIVRVNGQTLDNESDLILLINLELGNRMTWIIKRDGQSFPVEVTPRFNPPHDQWNTREILVGDVVVLEVSEGSPALRAGIISGDIIAKVNGQSPENHRDLATLVSQGLGSSVALVIQRDGKQFTVQLTSRVSPPLGQGPLGIRIGIDNLRKESRQAPSGGVPVANSARVEAVGLTPTTVGFQFERRSDPPWTAFRNGITRMGEVVMLIKNEFTKWMSGADPPEVTGPVGIGHMFVEVGQLEGISTANRVQFFIQLVAVISMALALFNILPIPALDGGRILFVLIEVARSGKRVSPRRENFVHMTGFLIMITALILITFMDITKLGDNLLGG